MAYDKKLLERWIECEEDDNEPSDAEVREAMWENITYCHLINRRIAYCRDLLKTHKDAFLYFVLAKLYSRYEYANDDQFLYMRLVRYCCIMAVRLDRDYAAAWGFLSSVYRWLSVVARAKNEVDRDEGACTDNSRQQIKFIENAILCVKKAIKKDPSHKDYPAWLKFYYQERNVIYKHKEVSRHEQ